MINLKRILAISFSFTMLTCMYSVTYAQTDTVKTEKSHVEKKWFENIAVRGYVQARYNKLFETNDELGCEQCDKSWGGKGGFFLRRVRIIFFGQISKQVYFYIQPDFASSAASDRLNFAQLRDAYFDIGLDANNEFRLRVGQSKIPYGFENLQSSQNRLALDRNDALNSAVSNERDLGVYGYWAPKAKRAMFSELVKSGLKGTGDYGIVGVGLYNGQTANQPEQNENLHFVARVTYPFKVKNQIVEVGFQGYTGQFVLTKSNLSAGVKYNKDLSYLDERFAGTFVLYPKPFGIQAEYNMGKGPEFNKVTDSIEVQDLEGGYIQLMYNLSVKKHVIMPFVKYQVYEGGKKHEKDARSYFVEDVEIGVEWQPSKSFELVTMYTISERRYEDYSKQDNYQEGSLVRVQAQINF